MNVQRHFDAFDVICLTQYVPSLNIGKRQIFLNIVDPVRIIASNMRGDQVMRTVPGTIMGGCEWMKGPFRIAIWFVQNRLMGEECWPI